MVEEVVGETDIGHLSLVICHLSLGKWINWKIVKWLRRWSL